MQTATRTPHSVIVGLGRTGVSAARHLAARGHRLVVTDTRAHPPGLADLRRLVPGAETALGAALGVVAVIVRQEIVLAIMGGLFVLETVSVILQVASFRLRGKRIFRMAPIHHHYELKGWAEPKVIVRFWIISFMLVLIGLATLKLR